MAIIARRIELLFVAFLPPRLPGRPAITTSIATSTSLRVHNLRINDGICDSQGLGCNPHLASEYSACSLSLVRASDSTEGRAGIQTPLRPHARIVAVDTCDVASRNIFRRGMNPPSIQKGRKLPPRGQRGHYRDWRLQASGIRKPRRFPGYGTRTSENGLRKESNLQPTLLESVALPIELLARKEGSRNRTVLDRK